MSERIDFDQSYEKYFPETVEYFRRAMELGHLEYTTVEELTKMLIIQRMKLENEDMITHMLPLEPSYQAAAIMHIAYGNIKGNLENCLNECNCSEEFKNEMREIALRK